MLEEDYIMRLLMNFFAGIRRCIEREEEKRQPSEAARTLDTLVGDAVDLDPDMLLSLTPDSAAGLLKMSGTDPRVVEYVSRTLLLSSSYYSEAGEGELADLRQQQAHALAEVFDYDLPDEEVSGESMQKFLDDVEELNES